MSRIFFEELDLPRADFNLGVGSGSHAWQTGTMFIRLEEVIRGQSPDVVLVYGDTNSTLAGALAAAKLHVPVAHVEAGLRSFAPMPEEINRVVTDRLSQVLMCPTATAVFHLGREGLEKGVHLTGDVMLDAALQYAAVAKIRHPDALESRKLDPGGYLLLTLHRAENTDHPEHLRAILEALAGTWERVFFPVHPRTRKILEQPGWDDLIGKSRISLGSPVGYLEMLILEQGARMILTDSGGVQKEAYFFGVPCLTLRRETEWVETVEAGWNRLVGWDQDAIRGGVDGFRPAGARPEVFGDGNATEKVREALEVEIYT